MKADCPVCNHTFEGDTSLSVALALSQHLKSLPDDPRHIAELSKLMEQIDREVNFAMTTAKDDSAIRKLLYDKCTNLDPHLQTLYHYAVSHLTIAIDISREMMLQCGDQSRVSEQRKARALWLNLKEALLVVERKFTR